MRIPSELTPASYDDFPYPSHAYSQTHPDHLATLAILSGLAPAPVGNCRVLELGCASGGNLIPIAYSLPGSEFVGVDFSGKAIAAAKGIADRLELDNIIFRHNDFREIQASFGQFDYIIAYGIYSWVPAEVQSKILDVCRENLSPNGVAYISYNTYPGWHMFRIVRELMQYTTRDIDGWPEKVQRGRQLVEMMSEQLGGEGGYYGHLMRTVHSLFGASGDGYLRHDFMAEFNEPLYFHEFVDEAARHGLQYLANGELNSRYSLPEDLMESLLATAKDDVEAEQLLDFLRNRTFRETLLCDETHNVKREMDPGLMANFWVTSQVKPDTGALDILSQEPAIFNGPGDKSLSTAHPLTKAALVQLADHHPRAVRFSVLVEKAKAAFAEAAGATSMAWQEETEILASNLLRLYGEDVDLVNLHTFQPQFVLEISDRPLASAMARIQAEMGIPVTNLYHQRIEMKKGPSRLLTHLDGRHDRQALLELMQVFLEEGIIEVLKEGQPVEDKEILRPALVEALDMQLEGIARAGLLVA